MMLPEWLTTVAWIALSVGFAGTLIIAADIFLRGYRLKMGIMEAVWPSTGLYFGPVAVWGYYRFVNTGSVTAGRR